MRGRSQQSFTTLPLPLSTAVPITDTAHTATTMFPNPFQTELASWHNHHWRYIIIKQCSEMFHSHNLLFCVSKPVPHHVNSIHYFVAMSFPFLQLQLTIYSAKNTSKFTGKCWSLAMFSWTTYIHVFVHSSLCIIYSFTIIKFHKMHSILLNSLCCCCLFLSEILKQVTDQPEARDQGQQLKTDWFSLC